MLKRFKKAKNQLPLVNLFIINIRLFITFKIDFNIFKHLILKKNIQFRRLQTLTETNNAQTLVDKYSCTVIAPKFIDFDQKKQINVVPKLSLFKFEGGIINSRSNAILTRDKLYVDTYCDDEIFDQGLIHSNNKSTAKIRTRETHLISEGFFLAGLGSFNWYHWLIEILPKVIFFEQSGTKTLLVDESVAKYNSMLDSLKILLKELDCNLVLLSKEKNYYVEKLFYVGSINYLPFNVLNNRTLNLDDFFYHPEILNKLRGDLIKKDKTRLIDKCHNKIYLDRKNHRVPNNHDEFISKLVELGFSIISVEKLDFFEQVELFQNARLIIGITGAGFTNLLFANKETTAYCISPSKEKEFACFSNLADIVGMDLTYIPYNLEDGLHHYSNNFDLDINAILEIILRDRNYV
jgi:capsular polysaccharide biosynthesis protein